MQHKHYKYLYITQEAQYKKKHFESMIHCGSVRTKKGMWSKTNPSTACLSWNIDCGSLCTKKACDQKQPQVLPT